MIKTSEEPGRDKINNLALNRAVASIKMEVDRDPSINYEVNSKYLIILPLQWILAVWVFLKTFFWAIAGWLKNGKKGFIKVWFGLPKGGDSLKPKYSSIFFGRFCKKVEAVRYGAASWRALDLIYHYEFGKNKSFFGRMSDFWFGSINCQAIRNRIKLIKKELERVFVKASSGGKNIRVFSVACGSAEAVIEMVKKLKSGGVRVDVVLLDLDRSALDFAKSLAEKYDVSDQFTFICANIKNFERRVVGNFDVIEMLGFLDYQTFPKACHLIDRLRQRLVPGGYFLTCNIMPNLEHIFVRWVVSWPMIYRRPSEIAKIMIAGGFKSDNVNLKAEPQKIHCLAICKND